MRCQSFLLGTSLSPLVHHAGAIPTEQVEQFLSNPQVEGCPLPQPKHGSVLHTESTMPISVGSLEIPACDIPRLPDAISSQREISRGRMQRRRPSELPTNHAVSLWRNGRPTAPEDRRPKSGDGWVERLPKK